VNDTADKRHPIEELLLRFNYLGQCPGLFLCYEEFDFLVFLQELITQIVEQPGMEAVNLVKEAGLRAGKEVARSGCGCRWSPFGAEKSPLVGGDEAVDIIRMSPFELVTYSSISRASATLFLPEQNGARFSRPAGRPGCAPRRSVSTSGRGPAALQSPGNSAGPSR